MTPTPLDELAAAVNEVNGSYYNIETQSNDAIRPSGARPCPICGQTMAVEELDGVSIDLCASHGLWLDNLELEALISRARSRQSMLDTTRMVEMVRRARLDGKKSALLYGSWSFLFDA